MAKNTVIVSVLGDTRDLQRKLSGATGSMGKLAKAAAAGAAVVVGGLTAIGIRSVKSASELEQAMGGMGAVFKQNAAQMEQFATAAAGSLGLAKSEYANLATVLGSQMKNMGVSTDALAGQTHQLIGLGADLSAQFGGSTSEAVSALSSLLRGERDPIERYGVSMNEAAIKAKMAEMGLSGLTGEAEKNAKLQATLALLYQQTADAQGAFTRESTTLAGAQQRLTAGTENLYATLGTSLLPAVTAVTSAFGAMINKMQESGWFQTLTQNLTEASNKFADFVFGILNGTTKIDLGAFFAGLLPAIIQGIQNAADWIASGGTLQLVNAIGQGREALLTGAITLFRALVDALPQIIPAVVDSIKFLLQDLVGVLVDNVPALLDAAVEMFTTLVDAITVILPDLLDTLISMLPDMVGSLLSLIPKILDAATELFTALVDAIPIILPKLVDTIVKTLPKLIDAILGMLPEILDAAINLFTALIDAIPVILPVLIEALIDLIPMLVTTILGMIPKLIDAAIKLFTALVNAVPRIIPKLLSALWKLGEPLVRGVMDLVPRLVRAGGDLVAGLARGLRNNARRVVDGLLGIARNAINAFKSFFGIRSPSRLMGDMGTFLTKGLAGGIEKDTRRVLASVRDLNRSVRDEFDTDLTGGPITLTGSSTGSGGGTAIAAAAHRTYNITVQAIAGSVETGRAIVDAIREYERFEQGGQVVTA